MSKYSEALETLYQKAVHYPSMVFVNKETADVYNILKVAIQKAEKYDNDNITYKKKFDKLVNEYGKLKNSYEDLLNSKELQEMESKAQAFDVLQKDLYITKIGSIHLSSSYASDDEGYDIIKKALEVEE